MVAIIELREQKNSNTSALKPSIVVFFIFAIFIPLTTSTSSSTVRSNFNSITAISNINNSNNSSLTNLDGNITILNFESPQSIEVSFSVLLVLQQV